MTETKEERAERARATLAKYRFKGKLTAELQLAVIERVEHGAPPATALKAEGVADSTIRLWRGNAEKGEKKYADLFARLDHAWELWKAFVANQLPNAIQKDARQCVEVAGRIMPEYEKRDTVDVNVDVRAIVTQVQRELLEEWGNARRLELESGQENNDRRTTVDTNRAAAETSLRREAHG